MGKTLFIQTLLLSILLQSCHNERKMAVEVINESGKAGELCRILEYSADYSTDKQRAIYFLIANLPGKHSWENSEAKTIHDLYDTLRQEKNKSINSKRNLNLRSKLYRRSPDNYAHKQDLQIINADSILYYMNMAFNIWEKCPWSADYNFDQFKEYILPYRISTEPLEYNWRKKANNTYSKILGKNIIDIKEACYTVSKNINFDVNSLFWRGPLQSYSVNSATQIGKCDDKCIYVAMVMRSLGIPVSIETIPFWGDHNNGHSFNALITPQDSSIGFNNTIDLRNRLNLSGKTPKIYRKTYEIQRQSILYKLRKEEYIPEELNDFSIVDVTKEYDLELTDYIITTNKDISSRISYLCVFSLSGWKPIAWAPIIKQKAKFENIGTGYLYGEDTVKKGENIGDGILYLPVYYSEAKKQIPIDYPYIIDKGNKQKCLKPNHANKRTIILTRKFPRKTRIINFAEKMNSGYFEVSNNSDFSDSQILHYIIDTPGSYPQKVELDNKGKYRYVRYMRTKGGLSASEISFSDKMGNNLKGKIIADDAIMDDPDINNLFDNDNLTFFDTENVKNLWIGMDFLQPVTIAQLLFCPRTDDNEISPGDKYELFYWENKWISLGRQTAEERLLTFKDVPSDALYWLRNLTKGREERPFIYENNKQIWH